MAIQQHFNSSELAVDLNFFAVLVILRKNQQLSKQASCMNWIRKKPTSTSSEYSPQSLYKIRRTTLVLNGLTMHLQRYSWTFNDYPNFTNERRVSEILKDCLAQQFRVNPLGLHVDHDPFTLVSNKPKQSKPYIQF